LDALVLSDLILPIEYMWNVREHVSRTAGIFSWGG
jgi:hypothetical protein